MRLFLYYTSKSFKNQLKKMFKSWVLALIVICALFGFLIGFGASKISDFAEQQNAEAPAEAVEEENAEELTQEELFIPAEAEEEEILFGEVFHFEKERFQIVDLIISALILLLFLLQLFVAEKGANRIFLPADTQFLFASPLKPQSVLLFRLMMQIAASLVGGIYLFFRLPEMMLALGFGWQAATVIIFAYILLIFFGRLMQVLIYTLASTHPGLQRKVRIGIYVFCAILLGGFAYLYMTNGQRWYRALVALLAPRWTRWIPFLGWLKGIQMFAIEGNAAGMMLCLLLFLLGSALLVYLIWHIKADFYEDAQAQSEETAELMEAARREGGVSIRTRNQKDRSERLLRDGFRRGFGASVFFWKAMYNRYRFAHFHFLTKTTETYIAVAAATLAVLRLLLHTKEPLIGMILLGVIVFYRSLGNPLEEDTKTSFFLLVPESCMSKLFFSLMAGAANTALDLLPAMLILLFGLGTSPFVILGWLCFLVSVDLYSTVVATFIAASTPQGAGQHLKQVAQILFLYFGLTPIAAILAIGIVMKHPTPALLIATIVNLMLAAIFFVFIPAFLDPAPKKAGTSSR